MDDDCLSEDITAAASHGSISDPEEDADDALSVAASERSSPSRNPAHIETQAPSSEPDEPVVSSTAKEDPMDQPEAFLAPSTAGSAPTSSVSKSRLNLLDLPLDILKEILKEITLTNDLTALALTCSALHSLAIPAMYSRFDIVWPEPGTSSDQPVGVDALSYGLATLVMGDHAFRELPAATRLSERHRCQHCGCDQREHQTASQPSTIDTRFGKLRFGNYYARWTKNFSVGNGPPEWVREYSITRETGKMLGTLVALAVARMVNLESFVWDMPTGVMRDVFLALASLGTRANHECRLEKVWIRWHDNYENNNIRNLFNLPDNTESSPMMSLLHRYGHVEYPSFSILPPLKSLTVLNIDEPVYLEEMAALIDRSRSKLSELRIGMSRRCSPYEWVYPADMLPTTANPPPRHVTPGWPKEGGVMSILLENCGAREDSVLDEPRGEEKEKDSADVSNAPTVVASPEPGGDIADATQGLADIAIDDKQGEYKIPQDATNTSSVNQMHPAPDASKRSKSTRPKKVSLETLELEHVVLSAPVMMKALDWTRLTTLTLLHCEEHETLWRALRKIYSPPANTRPLDAQESTPPKHYPLNLKHLHTDRVSPYLMLFLKDSIAPNTLESLFFQEGNSYDSIVSIDAIYKHVLRRQRSSLRKLLIDRSRRNDSLSSSDGHWRQWLLPRDALHFLTSGRMPQLRELGIGMDRRDWHFFLQRLPNIPHLRALYLPNMYDPSLKRDKQRELALQILDIVALRPEIQLCYVGIETKCFEILETTSKGKRSDDDSYDDSQWYAGSDTDSDGDSHANVHGFQASDDEEDEDEDNVSNASSQENGEDVEVDEGYSDEDEENSIGNVERLFKLREILYYDDKVSIFKARHCSL